MLWVLIMSTYSLTHLSDQTLLADLAVLVAADRQTTAALLAHIAEVDARGLYLPAACASMHAYCTRVLHLAEDAAFKRIRAARAARQFPQIFEAVADGRLHLSGVVLLAPHLTDDASTGLRADELLAAAAHLSKGEIELLLARHRPRPDLPTTLAPVVSPGGGSTAEARAPGPVADAPRARVMPLAAERFAFQVTIDQSTQEKLTRAQALLRHRIPSGDLAQVLDRALDVLLATLERGKFAAAARPRAGKARTAGSDPRYVPADVKRAVHARDGEQCSFVSEDGERCSERGFLEIDHVNPIARGGQSTIENTRMMCKGHNAYEAERVFGAAFMQERRRRATTAPADTIPAVVSPVEVAQPVAPVPPVLSLRAALAALHPKHANRCSDGPGARWNAGPPWASRSLDAYGPWCPAGATGGAAATSGATLATWSCAAGGGSPTS